MLAGCYTLDLYCDNPGCPDSRSGPDQYTAEKGATCRYDARRAGCPSCSGKKRKPRVMTRGSLEVDKRIDEAVKNGARVVTVSELYEHGRLALQRRPGRGQGR